MFLDNLFGMDRPAPPQTENVSLLVTVNSPEERAVIESLLRGAEIPYLLRDRGAGEAVRLIMGSNMNCGCDIYVAEEQLEEALSVISSDELSDEYPEEGFEEYPDEGSEDL